MKNKVIDINVTTRRPRLRRASLIGNWTLALVRILHRTSKRTKNDIVSKVTYWIVPIAVSCMCVACLLFTILSVG